MLLLRRFVSRLSLYLVAVCFFLTANAFVLFNVVNAGNFKETLKASDAYGKMVPAVLSTATYPANVVGQLPLDQPWVEEAARKAFPASDLEIKAGQFIDGNFAWIEGRTAQPEYRLDFTDNKQRLADEIGDTTESRLSVLPRCGLNELPDVVDPFRLKCLPFGLTASAIADRATSEIATAQNFLKDPVITPDNIFGEADAQGVKQTDPFAPLGNLRPIYENKDLLVWALPVATVLFALIGTLLATNRVKALRRLYRSFFSAAAGLLVFGLILRFGLNTAIDGVARDRFSQEILNPVFQSLINQAQVVYTVFAAVALLIGLVLYFVSNRLTIAR